MTSNTLFLLHSTLKVKTIPSLNIKKDTLHLFLFASQCNGSNLLVFLLRLSLCLTRVGGRKNKRKKIGENNKTNQSLLESWDCPPNSLTEERKNVRKEKVNRWKSKKVTPNDFRQQSKKHGKKFVFLIFSLETNQHVYLVSF